MIEVVISLDAEESVEDELSDRSDAEIAEQAAESTVSLDNIETHENDLVHDDAPDLVDYVDHDDIDNVSDKLIDIDPVLLKIYYDESLGHIESIKQQLDECESENQPLIAGKSLLRAFHTLYGSARTAEVEPIADLTGAAEKYIKARQDGGEENIPDDVAVVFSEIKDAVYYDTGDKYEYLKTVIEFALKHPDLNGKLRDYLKTLKL